jgi:hypothetical protein
VDSGLRPILFTRWRKESAVETSTSGQRNGNRMAVTVRVNDGPEKRQSVDVRGVYFGSVLEDLIVRNAGRRSFRLRFLDIEKITVATPRIQIRSRAGGTIEASVYDGESTVRYRLSPGARLQEMRIDEFDIRSYAVAAADARNIVAAEGSFFPPVKSWNPFPNPYTVTWARVQVKWKDFDVSGLRLEDSRQTLVRTGGSGNS